MGYFIKNRAVGKRPNGAVIPKGITGNRPQHPVTGLTRYNATIGTMEFWNGSNWVSIVIPGQVNLIFDNFTGDNVQTTFTMTQAPLDEHQIIVFVGGVFQDPVNSFNVSGMDLEFLIAPPQSTSVIVIHNLGKIA